MEGGKRRKGRKDTGGGGSEGVGEDRPKEVEGMKVVEGWRVGENREERRGRAEANDALVELVGKRDELEASLAWERLEWRNRMEDTFLIVI